MNKFYICMIVMILVFISGFGLGYVIYHTPHGAEQDAKQIVMHDSSIVFQRVHDTVLTTKLVKVPDTKVIHDVEFRIVPDTLVKVDTVRHGDTVYITRTIGKDTIDVRMAILRDKKNGGLRIQAKVDGGTIIGAIDVPRDSLIFGKDYKNTIALWGKYGLANDDITAGLLYQRGVGPFVYGFSLGTTINNLKNINAGVQAGVRF